MLKNIPSSFTPELVKLMMEMGHGEELLIADANYPAIRTGNGNVTRLYIPMAEISGLLADILRFFPLDSTEYSAVMMESSKDSGTYAKYCKVLSDAAEPARIETVERFAFYDKAAKAVGIVITADTIKGGNILLKKGVVRNLVDFERK